MASELLAPAGSLSDLSSRFDGLASRIRRVALLRGLGQLALIAAALLGIGLLADWFWPLPQTVRTGWLALSLGTVGYVLWTKVVRPVFRQFTVAELAALVEVQCPELGERLTSVVELTDPTVPETEKGSALMREWLEAETLASTKHIDFRKAVSSERATKSAWTGGIAGLLLLIPFAVMPSAYNQLWARLLTPWGLHELPAVLYFHIPEGDRVVARGEDVTIIALPPSDVAVDDLPAAVELVWTTPTGETYRRAMDYDAQQNAFVVTLPHVFEDFEYLVTAKRKRSDRHTITVADRPEIVAFTLTITPPGYTNMETRRVDGAVGNVEAFERSRIRAVLEFNKPLAEAHWLWRDAKAEAASRPTALPFQLSEDKKSATLDLLASEGWFSAKVMDEHGLTNLEEPLRNLIIIPDAPPELELSGQIDTTRARKDDVITVHAQASDDVAVMALELHIETATGHTEIQPTPEEELGGSEAGHTFRMDLKAFDLADGQWLKYRVRAADNRPVPGPNETWSDEQRILIDPQAELPGSAEIAKRQNEWRDILEAIRADLRKNLEETEQLLAEAEAQKANGQPLGKQPELAKRETEQRELADRLEALAVQFGGHRLFSNLTPETQRIAREPITQAAEEFQKTQRQNDLAAQTGTLRKSEEALVKADEDLEQLAKRFDEIAELERALQVLPRLAQQAERVADQALELAKRRDNPPANETPEQQAARESQLAQEEALLEEERQRLADDLDELLKRSPEVLEAAKKTALEHIAELSEEAARLAERQDALTESLKAEAAQVAEDAAPIADHQAELVKKAEALNPKPDKPEQQQNTPQVEPVNPEELQKVLEDLKAGDLEAAADRQKALADRLDALAEELKKNQELPNDPQKAAAQLADRERELRKQIAEAAKNAPPENAPAEEQQAHENKLQKLAEQQTGIQAGIAQLNLPVKNREQHQHAADQAAETVKDLLKANPDQAVKDAEETAEALDQLAKNIGTPEERKADAQEAAESLSKKQSDLVKETAVQKNAETAEALAKRQKDLAEQVAGLDAPGAEQNRQAALDALQKAAKAQEQLEELIKQQEKQPANTPEPDPKADEELQRLMQQNAKAQKKAADALEQLQQELAKEKTQEELQKEADAEQLAKQNRQLPKPEDVEKLAQEARAVAKEIEELQKKNAAAEPEQVAQTKRPAYSEPNQSEQPPKPGDAQDQNPQRADNQLPNDPQKDDQQPNVSDPNDPMKKPSDPNDSKMNPADPKGSRPEQSPAPKPGEESSPAPKPAENTQNATEPKTTDKNAEPANDGKTSPENAPRQNPQRAEDSSQQSLAERQAEQARKAAELALQIAEEQGKESPATKAAAEAARKASAAQEQTQDGALENASQTAQAAAEAGKSAGEELTKNFAQDLAEEAGKLAEDQEQLAQEMAQAAADPEKRQAARQAGQGRLKKESQKLADELNEAAKKLASTPLNLDVPGEKTEAAGQAAAQATSEMQKAEASAAQGNAAQAAAAGQEASEALRKAAGQSPAPPEATPENTLVPGDLAEQVADARRRLEEARQKLQNARKESQTAQAPMNPPPGMPPGEGQQPMNGQNNNDQPGQNQPGQNQPGQNQPGQNQPGQNQPGQNQPGQNQPGQNQPGQNQPGQQSALAQSAQSLQQAAQSLQQAAQQMQGGMPGKNGSQGQPANSMSSMPGQPSPSGSEGPGSSSPIPIQQLESVLNSQDSQEWGQLPGHLRTEILQGNKKKTEGDYARLIKLYSEELLKKQQAESRQK